MSKELSENRETDAGMSHNGFVKKAMVIGGGIAGISASIDLGNGGYEVVLVEKLPSIGVECFSFPKLSPRSIVHSAP